MSSNEHEPVPICITVMADYGGAYAWKSANCESLGSCWSCDRPLDDELQAWQAEFEATDFFLTSSDPWAYDWERFHARGTELAVEIKREYGDRARVFYEKANEDPNAAIRERIEVFVDGSFAEHHPKRLHGHKPRTRMTPEEEERRESASWLK
jgi:hypothetical protein